jgi:hypothetical protein
VLDKNGHTNIVFYELGSAMTKAEATEFLTAQGLVEAVGAKAPAKQPKAKTPTRAQDEAVLALMALGDLEYDADTDSFVEPKDERVQVAMSRLAKERPGATAQSLLDTVMMTFKEFGDYEPNF